MVNLCCCRGPRRADARALSYDLRLHPLLCREFMFALPDTEEQLASIRLELQSQDFCTQLMFAKIEEIVPKSNINDALEKIVVSIWKVSHDQEWQESQIRKVC